MIYGLLSNKNYLCNVMRGENIVLEENKEITRLQFIWNVSELCYLLR